MPGGRPIRRETLPAAVRANTRASSAELRNPVFPGIYTYVGDPLGTGFTGTPDWQNNFTWFGDAYVGFRHGMDGYTEFIGQIDLTAGGVTGTVAFTLPAPYRAITFSYPFPIFVEGTTWWNGILSIDGSTGDVTVYWPIEATAI
jgi:hypothetical protein